MQKGFILISILFFLFATKVSFAATITHTSQQSEIEYNEALTSNATLEIRAADGTEYYLRGIFYKEGSNNYCGYTWNGEGWFSGPYSTDENWKKFLKIKVKDNKWEGEIKSKLDPEDNGCANTGEYRYRIQRFTITGSGTYDDQEEQVVHVTIPTPTPTPAPTSTPTPTTRPSPTSKPTKKETTYTIKKDMTKEESIEHTRQILGNQDKSQTIRNTPKATKSPTNNINSISSLTSKVTKKPSPTEAVESGEQKKGGIFILAGGAALIAGCGILLFKSYKNEYEN